MEWIPYRQQQLFNEYTQSMWNEAPGILTIADYWLSNKGKAKRRKNRRLI